jgi:hypothetical protein
MSTQVQTLAAQPVQQKDGEAPIALRVLFAVIGVAVVVALHAPITMLAASIVA